MFIQKILVLALLQSGLNFSLQVKESIPSSVVIPTEHNSVVMHDDIDGVNNDKEHEISPLYNYDRHHYGIGPATFFRYLYNLPLNEKGTCAYVALAMLLSYYDTRVNDDIVPDKYILKGYATTPYDFYSHIPGNQIYHYNKPIDNDYINELENNLEKDIQAKMLNNVKNAKGEYKFGIRDELYDVAMKGIIGSNIKYKHNTYGQRMFESDQDANNRLKKQAIEIIKQGRPVITFAYQKKQDNKKIGYHAVVSYDYNKYGDLISNFGWANPNGGSNSYTRKSFADMNYNYVDTILDLDFTINLHKHSQNFFFGGYFYCACSVYNDRAHDVNYTFDENKHYGKCKDCNVYIDEPHKLAPMGIYTRCTDCDYIRGN